MNDVYSLDTYKNSSDEVIFLGVFVRAYITQT